MSVCLSPKGMELGPRPVVSRGHPLDQWEEFLDLEGRVKDPERVKELVFRGVRLQTQQQRIRKEHLVPILQPHGLLVFQGVTPSQRKEVWKFLLGFYPWNSTATEREDLLRLKTSVSSLLFQLKALPSS